MPPCVVKAISAPPKSASSLYISMCVLSRKIFKFFGNTVFEVKCHENLEKSSVVLPGRNDLVRTGAAVAGLDPWVHVRSGRAVLSAHRQSGPDRAEAARPRPDASGGGGGHGPGAGLRPAGEPSVSGVGLPSSADEFPRTDLPAFFSAVDSHLLCGGAGV